MLDEDAIDDLEAAGIDEVRVRTALTYATRFGVCAKCYGRDLGRGDLVNVGWYPDFVGEKRFGNWLENLNDWAISRSRYWGTCYYKG